MSDLDYDARLTDDEIENHVCCMKRHLCKNDHFHQRDVERIIQALLLDLAQRAEADRAAVERVRALADWCEREEAHLIVWYGHDQCVSHNAAMKIRDALDPKADQ